MADRHSVRGGDLDLGRPTSEREVVMPFYRNSNDLETACFGLLVFFTILMNCL